ncbi:MAG: YlbF family regulator [Erysipelotrichaceae bacterium]|nr:YlbF family regulator [Erysipelotrichaceae bacterium]
MTDAVAEAAHRLNELILEDPLIKEYQQYESWIKGSDLEELEASIKNMQQELLEKKALNEDITELEARYNQAQEEFSSHPLVVNYLYLKEEVNNRLLEIESMINTELRKNLD